MPPTLETEIDRDCYARIGKRIRLRRVLLGLSQHQLAEASGISLYMLKRHEAGANKIAALALHRIAGELDMPFGYFLEKKRVSNS